MATKTAKPAGIALSESDARLILELFGSIKSADKHFKSCQSDAWRLFVSRNAAAPAVQGAFDHLQSAVNAAKPAEPAE